MKFFTSENANQLHKLIGKTFDNGAVSCNGELKRGRVTIDDVKPWKDEAPKGTQVVVMCDACAFFITKKSEFLIVVEKELK